jgi:uncharacterized membrane protein YtjA (UPF0391 family)
MMALPLADESHDADFIFRPFLVRTPRRGAAGSLAQLLRRGTGGRKEPRHGSWSTGNPEGRLERELCVVQLTRWAARSTGAGSDLKRRTPLSTDSGPWLDPGIDRPSEKGRMNMLNYALVFLLVGLIAGTLDMLGVAAVATQIAWLLFLIGAVLLLVHLASRRRTLAP